MQPTAPAVVLGSTQAATVLWAGADDVVDVVRRRSGGTAVWIDDDVVWVDAIVPRGHRAWDDDVSRSSFWFGDRWCDALQQVGVVGAEVHRGPLVRGPWSGLVCFGGVGPGEVQVGGRKVVGVAQRRTRDFALFQFAVPLVWNPAPLLGVLDLTPSDRYRAADDLGSCATGVGSLSPGLLAGPLVAAFARAVTLG